MSSSADRTPVDALLGPSSIAIVGASPREESAGFRVIRNLRLMGFPGPIYPVNPRYEEVAGLRCYPSLSQLPGPTDAAFLGIPAAQIIPLVDEAGRNGIKAVFINAVGFADAGAEGAVLQAELVRIANSHGIAISGPNNTGLINVNDGKAMWTARYMTPINKGPVAVVAQSGSVAMVLSEDERKLGLAYVVTCGNEANVTASDFVARIVHDDRVKVILVYLETLRKPEVFAAAAREAARLNKRIVVLKVGGTEAGRAMVTAHTGSLAGDDRMHDAFFQKLGVIRAKDIDEMLELAVLLSSYPAPPRSPNLLPVTLSGGEAAMIADIGTGIGLTFQQLDPKTLDRLKPNFPPFATIRNPLDGWGYSFDRDRFGEMVRALVDDRQFGTIAFAIDAPAKGGGDVPYAKIMGEVCGEIAPATDARIVFFSNSVGDGPNAEVRQTLDKAGIPYLSSMRTSLVALGHYGRLAAGKSTDPSAPAANPITSAKLAGLDEASRYRLLAQAGLPMADCIPARSAAEAANTAGKLGFPAVLKGWADGVTHKSDAGLVRLGLADPAAVQTAYDEVQQLIKSQLPQGGKGGIVVQPMAGKGVELILGLRNQPGFGSLIVVGLGGIFVELINKVATRIGPVSEDEAMAMLAETPAATLLKGVRGQGPFDAKAAAKAIAAFSRFGDATVDTIAAAEINPLIVLKQGAIGVDVVIEAYQESKA